MIPVRFRKCRWNSEKSDSLLILVEMIFADYQQLVLEEYQRKRAAGELSRRMVRLTSANFKEECEAACSQRYDRRDEKTLEEFFGPGGGDKVAWLKAIRAFDPDKFKPLVNFVKGKTRRPGEKVVELLAWLIDFRPRPCELERKYEANRVDIPGAEQDEWSNGGDEKEAEATLIVKETMHIPGISVKPAPGFGRRKIFMSGILLIVVMLGGYWAWRKSAIVGERGSEGCMYWTGDHYQPISCSQKRGDTLVVPLDPEKTAHFKKITRPDTITENSLGSIWYAKYNGVYECYTSPGYHPIDTSLKLRPLTDFVLIKHLHLNQDIGQHPK
jgi:hypothetical protein